MVKENMDVEEMVTICVNASLEKKAKDIVVMEVKAISSFADYFLICSGASNRHVQAIATAIEEKMRAAGYLPRGIEGETAGTWILIDYYDVVIHVFYSPLRVFYDLEGLWSEAPVIRIADDAVSVKTLGGAKSL